MTSQSEIKPTTLSDDLKVACEIWHFNQMNKPIWFGKIVDSLAWCMNKRAISHSLDVLYDWLILKIEFGDTEKGRCGKVFFIDQDSRKTISELYENHWKHQRK